MIQLLSEPLSQSRRDLLSKWAKSEEGQDFISLLRQKANSHIVEAGHAAMQLLEDRPGTEEVATVRLHASESDLYTAMAKLLTDVASGEVVLNTYKAIL